MHGANLAFQGRPCLTARANEARQQAAGSRRSTTADSVTGYCEIAGIKVFAEITESRLRIELFGAAGSLWDVTAEDVANAVQVERYLDMVAERLIDPPEDIPHCICPKYYPAIWESDK